MDMYMYVYITFTGLDWIWICAGPGWDATGRGWGRLWILISISIYDLWIHIYICIPVLLRAY